MCLIGFEYREKITSLDLLAMLCLMQPRRLLVFLAAKVHCWLMVNLVSIRSPRSFSAKLLSSKLVSSLF